MAREGLMDDTGYHGFDRECPEEPSKEECGNCISCGSTDCPWYDDWLDDEREE